MVLPVTSFYAALGALLLVGLAARIPALRRHHQVGIGDGDQPDLARAVRVHANAAEHMPIGLLLLALLEIQGGSFMALHLLGGVFLIARVLHAWGLGQSAGVTRQRTWGTLLTWLVLAGMAGWLLALSYISPA